MIATIHDNKYIYLSQLTQGAEEAIVDWFSVSDPSRYASGREDTHWDGVYRRYNVKHQRLCLPFKDELVRCCEANKIPLEIIDKRLAPKFPAPQKDQITETFIDGIKLEVYQLRALHAACNNEIGLVSAKTGSGKTEIMAGIVKMFRCPTLIITEQIVVLEQIVERLKIRKVVHKDDIGLFCFGQMSDGNAVIVGSIQSVSTPKQPKREDVKLSGKRCLEIAMDWIKKEQYYREHGGPSADEVPHLRRALPTTVIDYLVESPEYIAEIDDKYLNLLVDYAKDLEFERRKKWFKTRNKKAHAIQQQVKKCELLLVDECDLATSQQYMRLFKFHYNGRRRYGFSGTPFDKSKPVQNMFLREHLGNIISEAKREEVEAAGRIVPISFYMIGVGMDGNKQDCRAYDIALKEEIVENEKFHKLVARIAKQYEGDGTLILIDTSPIGPLGESLESLIPNSKFIFGKTRPKERRRVLAAFETRELKCLIGSKILKRGLDLSGGCENLIVVASSAKWSDFDQKIGRAVRLNRMGRARVFSFFFLNNKYLYRHSRENLKAVVDMGYPTRVIIGDKVIDGEKLIKSRFRIPR